MKINPDNESPWGVPIVVLNFGPYVPCILEVKVVFESKYVNNLKLSIERMGSLDFYKNLKSRSPYAFNGIWNFHFFFHFWIFGIGYPLLLKNNIF